MSLTTDELRDALHAYADDVALPDPATLVAGAQHKRDHARKVRTAVVAGAAAVLMAVVTVIGIQSFGQDKALTPAQLNEKHHTHYPAYTHGLKLTDIVDIPMQHRQGYDGQLPDDALSRAPDESQTKGVSVPEGDRVYAACDARYVGLDFDVRLGAAGGSAPTCGISARTSLTRLQANQSARWWAVTSADDAQQTLPVAFYTQVAWDDYPKSGKLTTDPRRVSVDGSKGDQTLTVRGSGDTSVSHTVTLRADQQRGATVQILPSTTGRFQVLVDGKAARLDYYPSKDGPHYGAVWTAPEIRGRWYDYFPDSANGGGPLPSIYGPRPGSTARITVRAVDTTGPWSVQFYWSKKQQQQ